MDHDFYEKLRCCLSLLDESVYFNQTHIHSVLMHSENILIVGKTTFADMARVQSTLGQVIESEKEGVSENENSQEDAMC